jgi:hypothetical protein
MRIVDIRPREDVALPDRLEAFDAYARARIESALRSFAPAAGSPPAEGAAAAGVPGLRYVAVLLVTELLPEPAEGRSAEAAFHAALGLPGAKLLHGEVRAGQRGGFDTAEGKPRRFEPVVRAGSVLLLAVPDFDAGTLERLAYLERHGAGAGRERGFGAVRFSDPIHRQGGSR